MTKKTIKIISVIMILVISMFIMGCESKKEKFYRMEQTRINYCQSVLNRIDNLNHEDSLKLYKDTVYVKDKAHLEEMNKIAKGDKELEEKMKTLWKSHEQAKKDYIEVEKYYKKQGLVK